MYKNKFKNKYIIYITQDKLLYYIIHIFFFVFNVFFFFLIASYNINYVDGLL